MRYRRFWATAISVGTLGSVFVAAHVLSWGGDTFESLLQLIAEIAAGLAVSASSFFAARRVTGRFSIAWYCWSAYGLLFAAGSGALVVITFGLNAAPSFPSVADLMFLSAVPAGVTGALALSRSQGSPSGIVVALLDGLLFATGLLVAGWLLVLGPVFAKSDDTMLVKLVSVAYPVTDAMILTLLSIAFVRASRGMRLTIALLCLGVTSMMLADSSLAYQTATGVINDSNSPLGLGWVVGLLAIAVAGMRPSQSPRAVIDADRRPAGIGVFFTLVPVGIALSVTISSYLDGAPFSPVVVWSLLVLIGGAAVRQATALYANNRMRQRLEYQADHDDLTGLHNRGFLRALLDSDETASDELGWQLLTIDLDEFKSINDSFGHSAGDQLLVELSRLLRSAVREDDVVAHIGGDVFVLALRGGSAQAADVARGILSLLEAPISIGSIATKVSASIGIVNAGVRRTAEELLRNADLAMYAAKAKGGGQFAVYTPTMHEAVAERVHLESDLRAAWNTDQLLVHFQPIVELGTGQVVSIEALVRWQHPERGMVGPDAFIPLAEETGLIVPIGERVLQIACNTLVALQRRNPQAADVSVSVNVSARQLRSTSLVDTVADALRSSGLDPRRLIIEITETAVIRDMEYSIRILDRLRAFGLRVALDDFGIGSSSIGNLRRLPVDIIKMDKSLVDHIPDGKMATGLLDAVAAMASALNLRTVVEGVERSDQADYLRSAGYDLAQGYYYARPCDVVAIDRIVAAGFLHGTDATAAPALELHGSASHKDRRAVLIVDDDDDFGLAVERLLSNEGLTTVRTRSLREARIALKSDTYAAVLADIGLTDGSGWDLIEALRTASKTAALPVVAMTGLPDDAEILNRAARLRCEYLGKPFELPALLAKLTNAKSLCRAPGPSHRRNTARSAAAAAA